MDYSNEDWDSLDWTPQIWSTLDETRERAPPAAKLHIKELKRRADEPDAYISHMKSMPSFHSCDAFSTKTDSTRQDDDAESVDSFKQDGADLERRPEEAPPRYHRQARGRLQSGPKGIRRSKETKDSWCRV